MRVTRVCFMRVTRVCFRHNMRVTRCASDTT